MDRNQSVFKPRFYYSESLSARRAWIEITTLTFPGFGMEVALRKESVDRNYQANAVDQILPGSLSARRAWIEIVTGY